MSLVGTHGKLEAFAPSHGVRSDDASLINYRKGVRNPAFVSDFRRAEPPAPEECGSLREEHVPVDAALLQAGNHAGATYQEGPARSRSAHLPRPPHALVP